MLGISLAKCVICRITIHILILMCYCRGCYHTMALLCAVSLSIRDRYYYSSNSNMHCNLFVCAEAGMDDLDVG